MKSRKKCRYYNMIIKKITSKQDGLKLEIAIMECKNPKGIVQFSHGMAEHKERYFDFMQYLNERGYICVIHDHRGHGGSVKSKNDYGYFYTENANYIGISITRQPPTHTHVKMHTLTQKSNDSPRRLPSTHYFDPKMSGFCSLFFPSENL